LPIDREGVHDLLDEFGHRVAAAVGGQRLGNLIRQGFRALGVQGEEQLFGTVEVGVERATAVTGGRTDLFDADLTESAFCEHRGGGRHQPCPGLRAALGDPSWSGGRPDSR
jgi:hypothetical protein